MTIHAHTNQATLNGITSAPISTDQTSPQTVSNGQVTFADGLKLGTTPTVGSFVAGKMYYDTTNKTVSVMIDGDVTLQMGQEEHILCWNNSGSTIPNGTVVRQTGANGDMPTITLAQADTDAHAAQVLGITTQAILDGASGLITCRGIVHDVDTSAFSAGDSLYLSSTVAGGITKTAPTDPAYFSVHVADALVINASTGSIYVNPQGRDRLVDLDDVVVASPATGDNLAWNGVKWVNKPSAGASVGTGVTFYLDNTDVIPAGSGPQTLAMKSLLKTLGATQYNESALVNNNTVLIRRFSYNTALGVTTINSGVWTFNTYCYVSNASQISSVPVTVRRAVVGTGTIAITGSGTSRTATITGSTPLISGDYDADLTLTGLIETPNGVFPISGVVGGGGTTCTITTLSTYTNESGVAFKIHKFMFTDATTEVNQLAVALTTTTSAQPAFSVNATDKLSISYYARTTSTSDKTLYLYWGSNTYTNFTCPLLTLHNEMPGLQGGTSNEYYHLTSAQLGNLLPTPVNNNSLYSNGSAWLASSLLFNNNSVIGVNKSTFGTVEKFGVNSAITADNNTIVQVNTGGNTNKALVLQRHSSSQTANIFECQQSTGTPIFTIGPNGALAVAPVASTGTPPTGILFTAAAHTALTASTEYNSVHINGNVTVQFATGALTTQRFFRVTAPTYDAVGASTITTAATLAISGAPAAGSNATITNAYALWVQAGTSNFAGLVQTAATGTGGAGLNLPHGTAPNSPVNGDIWTTTSGIYARINGATQLLTTADVSAAVILAPASSARNVIQPTASTYIPLTIKGASSQSALLTEWVDSSSTSLAAVLSEGSVRVASTSYFYIGVSTTDGSWRIGRSGNDLVIERRESGNWVTKQTMGA